MASLTKEEWAEWYTDGKPLLADLDNVPQSGVYRANEKTKGNPFDRQAIVMQINDEPGKFEQALYIGRKPILYRSHKLAEWWVLEEGELSKPYKI